MIITDVDQILAFFPPYLVQSLSSEIHVPCPFCHTSKHAGLTTYYKNHVFTGEDRMFFTGKFPGATCRHCGFHSFTELAELFFGKTVIVSPEIDFNLPSPPEAGLQQVSSTYVAACHTNVKREYWHQFGWSDSIIDQFKLGYGTLFSIATSGQRHLIPFHPYTVDGLDGQADQWCFEGRLNSKAEADQLNKPYNMKTPGTSRRHFWKLTDGNSDLAVVCEGVKDGISAYVIGYRHIFSVFGSATDRAALSNYLSDHYKRLIVFGDNDEAGQKLVHDLRKESRIEVQTLRWPTGSSAGFDLTDLLKSFGDKTADYITANLVDSVLELERGFISDYRVLEPGYKPPTLTGTQSLFQVRQDLPKVIDEFITNYKLRSRNGGAVKVLAAPPGAGKTYALIQAAQAIGKQALIHYKQRQTELQLAIDAVQLKYDQATFPESLEIKAQLEQLQRHYNQLSCVSVLYAGPYVDLWKDLLDTGVDAALWYNYEARNEDNCQNLDYVQKLSEKGYVARSFCETLCPFKDQCLKSGYLSQDQKRRAKPITYVRHQMLSIPSFVAEYDLIIIDENPLHVFDTIKEISADDLLPVTSAWQDLVDARQIVAIDSWATKLRQLLESNSTLLSGRQLFKRLDDLLDHKLVETLQFIDPKILETRYQPAIVLGETQLESVPNRVVPDLFRVMSEELASYVGNEDQYNTGLHLIGSKLHVFPLKQIKIAQSKPVIVADGTALPVLYGALLGRKVEDYTPIIHSDMARTTAFWGSDFTKTSINDQIGKMLADFNQWHQQQVTSTTDIFDIPYDLDSIPFDEKFYDSTMVKRMFTLLKLTAEKHKSLLFVTYKSLRTLLEVRMKGLYPDLNAKITYAHYGSLRGMNRYKDLESVLLIGCYRENYENVHRRAMAWAKLVPDVQYIDPTIILSAAPYHGLDRYEGYTYPTFANPFAAQFVDMIEVGEVQQAVDRIRLFTSGTPKYAYVAMSRPTAKWITSLESISKITNRFENERHIAALDWLREHYKHDYRFPTYQETIANFKISGKIIADLRKIVKAEVHDR